MPVKIGCISRENFRRLKIFKVHILTKWLQHSIMTYCKLNSRCKIFHILITPIATKYEEILKNNTS